MVLFRYGEVARELQATGHWASCLSQVCRLSRWERQAQG